jgi:DGQHR domain-containing protein
MATTKKVERKAVAQTSVVKHAVKRGGNRAGENRAVPPTKSRTYPALENVQRADAPNLKFYLFHAPAAEIAEWAIVDRMSEDNTKGIQRVLNRTKIRRINEYLSAPFSNTIATSVVVVFSTKTATFEDAGKGLGAITIDWSVAKPAATIVDGQHRVLGASKGEHGGIHLNVVGIVGADINEAAFQFLVINNNSSKVNPSHVKALFTDYKEEQLFARMLASGSTNVDEEKLTALDFFDRGVDSPFLGQIKWEKNSTGFVVANALEAGLAEVTNRSNLLSLKDVELDSFTVIWSTIKQKWHHLWTKETHLLEKASIQALTGYICDTLEKLVLFAEDGMQLSDPDVLEAEVGKILTRLEPSFFEVEWTRTGLDTRAGQELLATDFKQMASNLRHKKAWHAGLDIVSVSSIAGGMTKKGSRPLVKSKK